MNRIGHPRGRRMVEMFAIFIGLAWIIVAPAAEAGFVACPGDCDGDGTVDIDELVLGVRIALGANAECRAFDRDFSGNVTIDEAVAAVASALRGCGPPRPTPTNPPGRCCDCPARSFVECQALATRGLCFGWGDPCPTLTPGAELTGR